MINIIDKAYPSNVYNMVFSVPVLPSISRTLLVVTLQTRLRLSVIVYPVSILAHFFSNNHGIDQGMQSSCQFAYLFYRFIVPPISGTVLNTSTLK